MTATQRPPFFVVGTLPCGRQVTLAQGERRCAERSYGWLRNCPVYAEVKLVREDDRKGATR